MHFVVVVFGIIGIVEMIELNPSGAIIFLLSVIFNEVMKINERADKTISRKEKYGIN